MVLQLRRCFAKRRLFAMVFFVFCHTRLHSFPTMTSSLPHACMVFFFFFFWRCGFLLLFFWFSCLMFALFSRVSCWAVRVLCVHLPSHSFYCLSFTLLLPFFSHPLSHRIFHSPHSGVPQGSKTGPSGVFFFVQTQEGQHSSGLTLAVSGLQGQDELEVFVCVDGANLRPR